MSQPNSGNCTRRGFLRGMAAGTGATISCLGPDQSTLALEAEAPLEQGISRQSNDHVIYHVADDGSGTDVMRGFPPLADDRVTIDNYRARYPSRGPVSAGNTRWAHFHMREILPTQTISRGDGPIRVFPVKPGNLSEMPVPDGSDGAVPVSEWLRRSHTDAFLVLHDGVIVHEEYFHGMREDTPHHLWSTSKSISAGVMANLMALGKLDEDRPITDYVPELKRTGYDNATVRHLLDMQSGVDFDYASEGDKNTWPRWERAAGLARKLPDEPTNEGLYDFMTKAEDIKRLARPHGSYFYYKESDPQALAWACEKVAKTRFSDLISRFIWSRIGAEHDAYMVCDPAGAANPGGGLSTTLRDLGRWGQTYLNGDLKQEVIPRPFIDDILTNHDPDAITEESFPGPRLGQAPNSAYRSLHNIHRYPGEDVISASGNFGQFCEIFPKRKLVFVKLSTYEFEKLNELFALTKVDRAAFHAIADVLAGKVKLPE